MGQFTKGADGSLHADFLDKDGNKNGRGFDYSPEDRD